jgi:hypothetical protein
VLPGGPGERAEQLLELRVIGAELVQLGQNVLGFLLRIRPLSVPLILR